MIITRFQVILLLWDAAGVSLMYLVTVDLSHQLGAVSTCGGETCHCSGAGPERQRWAVGYTLHTERRPHSDLRPGNREESDLRMYRLCFHNDILNNNGIFFSWHNVTIIQVSQNISGGMCWSPVDCICWAERLTAVDADLSISSRHIPPNSNICPPSIIREGSKHSSSLWRNTPYHHQRP